MYLWIWRNTEVLWVLWRGFTLQKSLEWEYKWSKSTLNSVVGRAFLWAWHWLLIQEHFVLLSPWHWLAGEAALSEQMSMADISKQKRAPLHDCAYGKSPLHSPPSNYPGLLWFLILFIPFLNLVSPPSLLISLISFNANYVMFAACPWVSLSTGYCVKPVYF